MPIRLINLDADDTLWHNETYFRVTQERFAELMTSFAPRAELEDRLVAAERRNLSLYGYGVKGFTLSMLETALEIGGEAITPALMRALMEAGRSLMAHPVEPLAGVQAAIERLSGDIPLVLISKGDLFHQEAKLAASGLGRWFSGVEIVSEKDPETYRRVFRRNGAESDQALMAGNSVRSDVLPVLETGGYAALIPYPLVWEHERAVVPEGHPRFRELASLAELPAWVASLR